MRLRVLYETDFERRKAERLAASGDINAQAQHLRQRMRSGELAYSNVAMAAALGDPAAKALGLRVPFVSYNSERIKSYEYYSFDAWDPASISLHFQAVFRKSELTNDQIVNIAIDCAEQVSPGGVYDDAIEAVINRNVGELGHYLATNVLTDAFDEDVSILEMYRQRAVYCLVLAARDYFLKKNLIGREYHIAKSVSSAIKGGLSFREVHGLIVDALLK